VLRAIRSGDGNPSHRIRDGGFNVDDLKREPLHLLQRYQPIKAAALARHQTPLPLGWPPTQPAFGKK